MEQFENIWTVISEDVQKIYAGKKKLLNPACFMAIHTWVFFFLNQFNLLFSRIFKYCNLNYTENNKAVFAGKKLYSMLEAFIVEWVNNLYQVCHKN